jgi:L-glyceraldehyde 3-phosphate reductase
VTHLPSTTRYDTMRYNRCGRSGLLLPAVSIGLWHNFGGVDRFESARQMVRRAFDLGITHLDLANKYGPPLGSAEETLRRVIQKDMGPYRDELIISTKAGWDMWPGPYGNWGSRKYLISSLDQSLKRMGLDYVDIFYHHRPDPETPMEETMTALDHIVRQGKALYVGISAYDAKQTRMAANILRGLGTPCLIHQASYSMFERSIEGELLAVLEEEGIACIAFSPLAQGLLTDKYLEGIPEGSRASKPQPFLTPADITEDKLSKVRKLSQIALARGQTMAQMALAWVLRHKAMTSVLVGVSSVRQIEDNVAALDNLQFTEQELAAIDKALAA